MQFFDDITNFPWYYYLILSLFLCILLLSLSYCLLKSFGVIYNDAKIKLLLEQLNKRLDQQKVSPHISKDNLKELANDIISTNHFVASFTSNNLRLIADYIDTNNYDNILLSELAEILLHKKNMMKQLTSKKLNQKQQKRNQHSSRRNSHHRQSSRRNSHHQSSRRNSHHQSSRRNSHHNTTKQDMITIVNV